MSRKKINIDPERVHFLARTFCTQEDIALEVGCSVDTLHRRYADIIKEGRCSAINSLRGKQMHVAMLGNPKMLTWLGMQYLDQYVHTKNENLNNNANVFDPKQFFTLEVVNCQDSALNKSDSSSQPPAP